MRKWVGWIALAGGGLFVLSRLKKPFVAADGTVSPVVGGAPALVAALLPAVVAPVKPAVMPPATVVGAQPWSGVSLRDQLARAAAGVSPLNVHQWNYFYSRLPGMVEQRDDLSASGEDPNVPITVEQYLARRVQVGLSGLGNLHRRRWHYAGRGRY